MTGGVIVVLGGIGRNLAAGMSGGIAYVYDPDGTLESRTNMAMVELEPVVDDEVEHEAMYHQTRDALSQGKMKIVGDLTQVRRPRGCVISSRSTWPIPGSSLGQRLLDDWREAQAKFKKVMPVEYREAMAKIATTEAQILENHRGLSPVGAANVWRANIIKGSGWERMG